MKKIFFLLFLVLICVACSNSENREKKQLALCKNVYHDHNYEQIVEFCEPLSKKGNADASIMLASAEMNYGNIEKALTLLRPFLEKHNNKAQCLFGLIGFSSKDESIKKEAITYIQEGVENLTGDTDYDYIIAAKYVLAKALYTGNDIGRDYNKALKLFIEISEAETLPKDTRGEIYLILGTSYFIGIAEDSPENNDIAYKYWQKAYELENLGAKPLLLLSRYKDLNEYFSIMQAYKRFSRYFRDEEKIEEYKNWLFNGNGQKYLITNKSFTVADFLASAFYYNDMWERGYLFAKWYLNVNGADPEQSRANLAKKLSQVH